MTKSIITITIPLKNQPSTSQKNITTPSPHHHFTIFSQKNNHYAPTITTPLPPSHLTTPPSPLRHNHTTNTTPYKTPSQKQPLKPQLLPNTTIITTKSPHTPHNSSFSPLKATEACSLTNFSISSTLLFPSNLIGASFLPDGAK